MQLVTDDQVVRVSCVFMTTRKPEPDGSLRVSGIVNSENHAIMMTLPRKTTQWSFPACNPPHFAQASLNAVCACLSIHYTGRWRAMATNWSKRPSYNR